jgi:MCP family monocarboxylic acid transporter-like MFS transporter 10
VVCRACILLSAVSAHISTTVFLAYYLNDPQYMNQKHASSLLPLIGTLCTGLMYCLGLIIHPLMRRYPRFARRYFTWIGAAICWASLFGASYTRGVIPLVLLQGIGYAIGGSLLYSPCIMFVTEWFVERQSFANGVIFAGTGYIIVVILLLLRYL